MKYVAWPATHYSIYSLSWFAMPVLVCRLCVCQRIRSWPSVSTGRSWVTRNAQKRWDGLLFVCHPSLSPRVFLCMSSTLLQITLSYIPTCFPMVKQSVLCFPSAVLSGRSDGDSLQPPTNWEMPWHLYALLTYALEQGTVTGWQVKSPSCPHWAQCSVSTGLPVTSSNPLLA